MMPLEEESIQGHDKHTTPGQETTSISIRSIEITEEPRSLLGRDSQSLGAAGSIKISHQKTKPNQENAQRFALPIHPSAATDKSFVIPPLGE